MWTGSRSYGFPVLVIVLLVVTTGLTGSGTWRLRDLALTRAIRTLEPPAPAIRTGGSPDGLPADPASAGEVVDHP